MMEVDKNSVLFDGKRIEFSPEAQASPNPLIKYYFNYKLNYILLVYIFQLTTIQSLGGNGACFLDCLLLGLSQLAAADLFIEI